MYILLGLVYLYFFIMARIDVNKIGIRRFIDHTIIFKRKHSIRRDNGGYSVKTTLFLALRQLFSGRKRFPTLLWMMLCAGC